MPQRSNHFQKLIYLVQCNLAGPATVTESKMLRDRITGSDREVDVCIEGEVAGQRVTISVECQDLGRVSDVGWVERMKAKHERLATNVLVLASRRGFTQEAVRVADKFGIQTYKLSDVDASEFPDTLKSAMSLEAKSVTVSCQKALVTVGPTESLPRESVATNPDNLVYAPNGEELCQIQNLVNVVLKAPRTRDYLLEGGKSDHVWFEIRWEPVRDHLDRPLFMKKLEPPVLREIESVVISGPCKFTIGTFGMKRGVLGQIQVAWGTGELFDREALVVASRDPTGVEKMSVTLTGKPNIPFSTSLRLEPSGQVVRGPAKEGSGADNDAGR
jgi:hypothetical protein